MNEEYAALLKRRTMRFLEAKVVLFRSLVKGV